MLQKAHVVLLFHIVANRTAAAAEVANHLVRKQERPKQNSSNQASREEEEEEHQQQHSKKLRHSSTTMETKKTQKKNHKPNSGLWDSTTSRVGASASWCRDQKQPIPPLSSSSSSSSVPSFLSTSAFPFLSFLFLLRSSSPPLHSSSHPPQSRVLFPVSLSHCCCHCRFYQK